MKPWSVYNSPSTKITSANVVRQLQKLKRQIPDGLDDPEFGICWNLSHCNKGHSHVDGYKLVSELAPSWESFSGSPDFPIPVSTGGTENRQHLWDGEGLKLRLSLIDHMIKVLSEK